MSSDSSGGSSMPPLMIRQHADSSSDDDSSSTDSSMPELGGYHSDSSYEDDSDSDSSFIHAVNDADARTDANITCMFPAQDTLHVDPDDEDFLSSFIELSPNRAMIDQLIVTMGQRSTDIVLNSPNDFFQNEDFVESNRRMNLLIQMVAITSLRQDQMPIDSPADHDDVSTDEDEFGGTDSDGFHLPPLEMTRISGNDTNFLDSAQDEMRRLSLLHSPLFLSSVEAENSTLAGHNEVTRSIRNVMTSAEDASVDESVPDEDESPHINVAMIQDDVRNDLSIPSKFAMSPMKMTRALHDTGADDCTTNNPFILHDLHLLPESNWLTLHDAGHNPHLSKYGGTAKLHLESGQIKEFFMRYTPTMPVTVIDVSKMRDGTKKCIAEGIKIHHVDKHYKYVWQYKDAVDTLPLTQLSHEKKGIERYYTKPFLSVSPAVASDYIKGILLYNSSNDVSATSQIQVRTRLYSEAAHTLWHLRLAHSNDDILKLCQHKVDGVPHIVPRNTIDSCASCDSAKLTKVSFFKSKIPDDVKKSALAKPFQYLSADWGFIVQKSKNMDRYKRLMALNGDTCYLVLQCYKSDYVVGVTSNTKEAPLLCITKSILTGTVMIITI